MREKSVNEIDMNCVRTLLLIFMLLVIMALSASVYYLSTGLGSLF